ncbi:MAG: leucine-rich repeat domain-containing protein [Clostridia bacterium]|nr:leucine-rich repeat domain-containing protein [Clostridia bacterium]
MKKIALLLICFLMTYACIAIAEEEPVVYTCEDYMYILLEDGTAEITNYLASEEKIDIPKELDGHVVTSIGDNAFEFCSSATEIIIPDSVTSIGNYAFNECESLTEITIPDSVTFIGVNPFTYCLEPINIKVSPEHPTLATIDGVLFDKTEKKLICYPCAFTEETYEIPQGISSIGDEAFHNCIALTKIIVPESVSSFGKCSFLRCDNLEKIQVSPEHPTFATIDGVLFDKTEKKLIYYPCALAAESYSIPQGISAIGDHAFFSCKSLTKIAIPDSVSFIGDYAFASCSSLTEITIPDSVTSIGEAAFYICSSLAEITIPDSVTTIGDYAFMLCASLTEVTLPDSVTSVGNSAFFFCSALTEITIPNSVTFIGEEAFEFCDSLTLTVHQNSYAAQYAKENNLDYAYPDSLDWLNS